MGRQQQDTSMRPFQAYQAWQSLESRGLMLLDGIDDEHHTITSELLAEPARFFLGCQSRKKSEVAQRAQKNKVINLDFIDHPDFVSFCQISSLNKVHIDRTGI
jgi:hypothetical protein